VALEINESHRNATAEDLRAIKTAGAKLIISSDAHRPGRVGETPKGIALAREADVLDCVVNYEE
ncbi:MAG: histidinol-phosphatase, partial [Bacillota bacterium]